MWATTTSSPNFLPRDEESASYDIAQSGSGHMDHLAIDVDADAFDEAKRRLTAEGVAYEDADRGYERSIYFKDPNDVTIELLTWHTPPPSHLPQAAILKQAQTLREARGAACIEDEDIRRRDRRARRLEPVPSAGGAESAARGDVRP